MQLFKSCMNLIFFFFINTEDILNNVGNQTDIDFNGKNSNMEDNAIVNGLLNKWYNNLNFFKVQKISTQE